MSDLWEEALPTIERLALKYAMQGQVSESKAITMDDLIQVGSLAAWEASKTYDPIKENDKGELTTFPTYAYIMIWRRMEDEIRKMSDDVPMPLKFYWNVVHPVNEAEGNLIQQLGRIPDLQDLQEEGFVIRDSVTISLRDYVKSKDDTKEPTRERIDERIRKAYLYLNEPASVSIYDDADDADGGLLEEIIEDQSESTIEEQVEQSFLRDATDDVLSVLSDRQRQVILMRFDFILHEEQKEWTLEEVAKTLGITREGVRLIERGAIERLKHDPRSRVILRDWK